jgi:serine/threonine-protein kinase
MSEQRYKVLERLDAGGMAEVFKGEAESLRGFKKLVAIKRILPSLTKNKKFVSMFLDEARLSLHLNHANVVHVFDIGVADGTYFIVMEFVDGANLKAVVESLKRRSQRMSVAQAIYMMMEVCKGLSYAHEMRDPISGQPMNIVHRDISPPNVLMSRVGEVKIVDFGLAKAASQLELTDPGVVKGKFSYLSPEAASGMPIDHRSDVFSAGIVLYELLTGRRLFVGETDYQTVELVRKAYVPPVSKDNAEVPKALEDVLKKSLARDVNQRYQSARAFGDALAGVLFSHGLKVTDWDIAQLVQGVIKVKQQEVRRSTASVIDSLLEAEMIKFTSIDDSAVQAKDDDEAGARSLLDENFGDSSNDVLGAVAPSGPPPTVDPRTWSLDEDGPSALTVKRRPGDRPPPTVPGRSMAADSGSEARGRSAAASSTSLAVTSPATAADELPTVSRGGELPTVVDPQGGRGRYLVVALLIFFLLGAGAALLFFRGGFASTPEVRTVPAKTN